MKATAIIGVLGLSFGFASCADEQGESTPSGNFEVTVSALTLDGADDACFGITVLNDDPDTGTPETVFNEDWICASEFGAGTNVTYIGPCDADDGDLDVPAQATNWVLLVMRALCGDDDGDCVDSEPDLIADNDLLDWVNPCPPGTPCVLQAECMENQDTRVDFNITVMRQAKQGFFDIVVTFEDIFCAAKLDCHPELLPSDENGNRGETIVLGFACTGGSESLTQLHLNGGELVCVADDGSAKVEVDFGFNGLDLPNSGNQGISYDAITYLWNTELDPDQWDSQGASTNDPVYEYVYYRGREGLSDLNKLYANAAYGIDYAAIALEIGAPFTCSYYNSLTASDGLLPGPTGGTFFSYPKVEYCVEVGSYDGSSVTARCADTGLNTYVDPTMDPLTAGGAIPADTIGGVYTTYTTGGADSNATLCGDQGAHSYLGCLGWDGELGELEDCTPPPPD